MKTVCPHCHQKYDVPDDYLQQDVTCQKCEKDFTVTRAKFCSECGKANPAQVFQCYSCQRPFLLETCVSSPRTEQKQVSADRSETKLSLPLKIIVFIFGIGSGLSTLQGIGMVISAFSGYPELGNKGLTIIYGIIVVAIYGRLVMLLSTLTQPNKKAIQTPYSLLALLGGGILSIVGLIVSFIALSGIQQAIYVLSNFLTLIFLYQIYHVWGERCLLDIDYEESEISTQSRNSSLAHVSIILAVAGLIPMAGFIFSVAGIATGMITYGKGSKTGFAGMLLGILAFIGNIVFVIIALGNN